MKVCVTKNCIRGVFTAVVTPFSEDSTYIDYSSLCSLLKFQIESRVNGIVVAGSTGEAATLTDQEYEELIASTVGEVAGRIPVIAGINANSTERAKVLAAKAREAGADALLLVVPFYNKPSQDGIVAHFESVHTAVDIPIIAYNVPGRTATNMSPNTVANLAESGSIIALKDASGSMEQMLETLRLCRDTISVLSGEDSLTFSNLTAGGAGLISASANLVPGMFVSLIEEIQKGNLDKGRELQFKLLPLISAMFMETNPVPVKEALRQKGIINHSAVRLPLLKAQEPTVLKIKEMLQGDF